MNQVEIATEQIAQYGNAVYEVHQYTVSHKQLLVSVKLEQSSGSSIRYIRFMGVRYLQLLPWWENSPFVRSSQEDCSNLVKLIGDDPTFDRYLFEVSLPSIKCKVLCTALQLQETPDL